LLIEFLKCDHKTVQPKNSHPKRYWYNWRKFASLWRLKNDLDADLYLVNYEDKQHAISQKRQARGFLVIHVINMDPTPMGGITKEELYEYDFSELQEWFLNINNRARI